MKFSIFKTAKSQKGEECTYERYLEVANDVGLLNLCNEIAAESDKDKRSELKKKLPVITWQAFFEGKRVAKEAQPSGLFMLDIDHVENPFELYQKKVCSRTKELGIVFVGMTASRHGLRIIAKCLPTLNSIEECQRWLAGNLKVEYDGVCKDWARSSFLVHDSYTYYMDAAAIWQSEAAEGTVYEVETVQNQTMPQKQEKSGDVDQREGLFGGQTEYHGISLETICKEWLIDNGGEPEEGERNAKLFKLATRLRYICDFNAAVMLKVMPTYGLSIEEMKLLIHNALNSVRASSIPKDLVAVTDRLERSAALGDLDEGDAEEIDYTLDVDDIPALPPIFKEWYDISPDDFKKAIILCQLPILGTLGSCLRAEYLDGTMHSPSFQVSLEAPQASGKSFVRRLVDYELASIKEHDEKEREKERAYDEKIKELKLTNSKVSKKDKEEKIGQRPHTLIRIVPGTMSITKLLMRMYDAQGLHLFVCEDEIDTVYKAFKRGSFSNFSDALRRAFDNAEYGQDYASENSFSGMVKLFYNCLFCGTPKAMSRFYPDIEDGLVSRVTFVTLPDQFGKPMPIWGSFTQKAKASLDINLERLSQISMIGDEIQPLHVMKLVFLNKALEKWVLRQQKIALQMDDRTRDVFCRRSAVVGFRAGMIAWFLWEEKNVPQVRKKVIEFATWVANMMLQQHLIRFKIDVKNSNTLFAPQVYDKLPEVFDIPKLRSALIAADYKTPNKEVIYRWKMGGYIEKSGRKTYKKIQK